MSAEVSNNLNAYSFKVLFCMQFLFFSKGFGLVLEQKSALLQLILFERNLAELLKTFLTLFFRLIFRRKCFSLNCFYNVGDSDTIPAAEPTGYATIFLCKLLCQ
jgi:hypothetical protein